jgi:protein-S-isoprenylcysteine O-methyltransferase Ste14
MSPDPSLERPPVDAGGKKPDAPGVIAPPPLIYVAGPALLLAGFALVGSFVAAFRRAGTPVDVRKAPIAIVTTGPYRVSRNPRYLGLALIYAGITVLTGAMWTFVTLVPTLMVVDRGVIRREERYLERKFGEKYLGFKARTRRWI